MDKADNRTRGGRFCGRWLMIGLRVFGFKVSLPTVASKVDEKNIFKISLPESLDE